MLQTGAQLLQLQVLGGAHLHAPDRKAWKLERKTAGLLAFLTLEGGTTRSRLAGLLWPDSLESTARNNLSQVARRLREGAGIAVLTGDDRLSLSPELSIDASKLELEAFAGNDQTVLGFQGELLEGLDYDDCPEFQDWLLIKRESFLALRRDAHLRLSQAAEFAGQSRVALEHANHVLELDPVSEVAHRHVMRLHYQNGDRGAALNAFERCKQVLEQELGVPPLPETLALAKAISQGTTVEQAVVTRLEIPLTVLRPPVLIGRELEWTQLEHAWNQGIQIVICGEPGIGKSRLLFDFATSHGQYLLLEGRPGDANVSFSSYARSLRRAISTFPTLELEDWVQTELSRLLPELTNAAPAPLQNQEDKLRFFEAIACALETICQQQVLSSIVVDDLQFMDAASLEAHDYIVTRLIPTGLRFLNAHRTNELLTTLEERIQTEIGTGTTTRIELKSLETEQVSRWIASLEINAPDLSARLVKHTGGNPMFMLETIKSLLETNQLAQNTALPTPTRVGTLIRQRLERLSSSALRLARVAAITGTDYSLGLAAKILETNALDLSEIAGELEQAQLMTGERFAHDLIFEAVRADTPKSIATFVHTQTAIHLEGSDAEPARIAHHWMMANAEKRAVPFLQAAALQANAKYQLREVIKHASRAAEILERNGDPTLAWECWAQSKDAISELAIDDELETVTTAMRRTTSTPRQHAETLEAECAMWTNRGNLAKAKRIAEESMAFAEQHNDLRSLELAENSLGLVCWMQGKSSLAEQHFARSNEHARTLLQHKLDQAAPESEIETATLNLCLGLSNHAVMLDNFGRYQEAELEHQQAIDMLRETRDVFALNQVLSNLSITYIEQGLARQALMPLQQAEELESASPEITMNSVARRLNLSDALVMLDRFSQALEHTKRGQALATSKEHPQILGCLIRVATLNRILGAHDQAKQLFEASHDASGNTANSTNSLHRLNALYLIEQHQDASKMILAAQHGLSKSDGVYRWYKTHLELLAGLPTKQRMPIVNETLTTPGLQVMKGLQILALTRGAQQQLEYRKHKKALEYSQQAVKLLEDYDPELQRAEVLLTHQRALEANNHPDAPAHLERTLVWLQDVADNNVPPEYRQSFLERNPHNAAIIELARNAGLELP